MKKRLLLLLPILLTTVLTAAAQEDFKYAHARVVTPSGETLVVDVADNDAKRQQGLGFRSGLEANRGMLFLFDTFEAHSFWMKNMSFPIDIIWLSNRRVVHVEANVPPPQRGEAPKVVAPDGPANLVLEVAAGRAKQLGIEVGRSLRFEF